MKFEDLPLFSNAKAIKDDKISSFCNKALRARSLFWLEDKSISSNFKASFRKWVSQGDRKVLGLENFPYAYISYGITEALPYIYLNHRLNSFYIQEGEYPFHRQCLAQLNLKTYHSNTSIGSDDLAILSLPFSATGSLDLTNLNEVVREFNNVFLDLAMFGLTDSCQIDLSRQNNVTYVGFSLSKFFNLGRLRIGVIYSKKAIAGLEQINQWDYVNRIGCGLGTLLMNEFSIDYLYQKYRFKQEKACEWLGLTPSQTLIFGNSHDEKFRDFSRDGVVNRICLSDHLTHKDLN